MILHMIEPFRLLNHVKPHKQSLFILRMYLQVHLWIQPWSHPPRWEHC